MKLQVEGKLKQKLQAKAGTSKKTGKNWESQTCLIETNDEYNPIIAVEAFGEKDVKQMNKLNVGDTVSISCNVYSNEWNGQYFNKIRGWWFTDQSETKKEKGFTPTDFITSDDNDMPF